jgi:hypothetical protein
MADTVEFTSGDAAAWRAALAAYDRRVAALDKPNLVAVDSFYRHDLPAILRGRDPDPFLTKPELVRLLQWKLSRGKWRWSAALKPWTAFLKDLFGDLQCGSLL